MEAWGQTTFVFDLTFPDQPSDVVPEAELTGADGQPVRSARSLKVIP